jgi:hypothetical protein
MHPAKLAALSVAARLSFRYPEQFVVLEQIGLLSKSSNLKQSHSQEFTHFVANIHNTCVHYFMRIFNYFQFVFWNSQPKIKTVN